MLLGSKLYGYAVEVSEYAVEKVWIYPKERFWEYIPSKETERWCRFFGYGHEETKPCVMILNNTTMIVHPTIWAAMQKHLQKTQEKTERLFLGDSKGTYVEGAPCIGEIPLI